MLHNNVDPIKIWYILNGVYGILALMQTAAFYWFNRLKDLMIIKKRFPNFIKIEAVLVVLCLVVAFPLKAKAFYAADFSITIPEFVVVLIVTPLVHSVLIFECGRHWLICQELEYMKHSETEQWKSVIDASHGVNNYIVDSQKKFSTEVVIKKIMPVCLLCVTSTIYMVFLTVSHWEMYWAMTVFFSLFYVLFIVVVYRKCHAYKELADALYFHFEVRATAIIWSISWLALAATSIIGKGDCMNCIRILTPVAIVMAPSILSTIVIPYKIRSNALWDNEITARLTAEDAKVEMEARHQKLREVLKDGKKFDLFMKWLHRESSHELGYALIEMVQFKQSYVANPKMRSKAKVAALPAQSQTKQPQQQQPQREELALEYGDGGQEEKHNDDEKEEKVTATVQVRLSAIIRAAKPRMPPAIIDFCPASAPRSTIVHLVRSGMKEDAKYRVIAHALWEKYIKTGAMLEINVSHVMREYYRAQSEDNWLTISDSHGLGNVFDMALKEIVKLLGFSFSRYRAHLADIEAKKELKGKKNENRENVSQV